MSGNGWIRTLKADVDEPAFRDGRDFERFTEEVQVGFSSFRGLLQWKAGFLPILYPAERGCIGQVELLDDRQRKLGGLPLPS